MKPEKPNDAGGHSPSEADQAVVSLERAIETLARSFASHPGFMWTHAGFEVLHAEWPAYPRGHGVTITLSALAEYPRGTRFFPIDNIDQCTLFAVGAKPKQNPYDVQHLHVAAWDSDLRVSSSGGYIDGVHDEGQFLSFPDGSIELTPKGVNVATMSALLGPALDSIEDEIVHHLHEARYDTAVREASIRVEIALRRASGLSEHGRRLVEKCFGETGVLVPKGITNQNRHALRNAFHVYFKYVRNEFAHSLPAVDMLTACTLVRRSVELLKVIHEFDRGRGHDG